jgi:hypothetical protein
MPGEHPGEYILLKQNGQDVAGLYELAGEQFEGVPSHWMTYVTVENVDESARRAAELEGKIVAPPMDIPGVGRAAFLQDPTGATFALFQPGEHPGTAADGPFGWSELSTPDTARAESFYTSLFGWSAKCDDGGPIAYTEFQVGDRSIAGMMELQPEMAAANVPPHWLPYVMVDDCDTTVEKAGGLGARILVPPTDIPDVGRFSVFMDPTGAALAVIQLGC